MPVLLLAAAVAQIVLTVVQWFELVLAEAGGSTFCSVNETIDCATVWGAPFAKQVQAVTSVPVAGWGLVWALGAFAAALWLVRDRLRGETGARPAQVVRLFALGGVAGVVLFAGISVSMGALCLTCLTTYAITGVYAFAAYRLDGESAPWTAGLGPALGLVAVGYGLVLYPGTQTKPVSLADMVGAKAKATGTATGTENGKAPAAKPDPHGAAAKQVAPPPTPGSELARFLGQMDPRTLQAIADGLAEAKAATPKDVSGFAARPRHFGPENAPVRIVDFSDIRCGHCANFAMASAELHRLSPPGGVSQVSRWFPLDAECNGKMPPNATDGSGVRCAGAKTMICLEGKEGYEKARLQMFAEQRSLTLEKINEIAVTQGGIGKAALEACLADPSTDIKLREDIEYATKYGLEGTPMVLVNDRRVPAVPPFLFALILAEGNLEHPAFGSLPEGRVHDHAGHDHAGHDH